MSLPTSRRSYPDCFDIFDQALESDTGIRIRCKDIDAATFQRMRLHQARSILRNENKQVYDEGTPDHNTTIYDRLVVRIKTIDKQVYIYVEHVLTPTEIEPIPENDDANTPAIAGDIPHNAGTSEDGGDRDRDQGPGERSANDRERDIRSPESIRRRV